MPKPIATKRNGPFTIRAADREDDSLVIGADETVAEILIYGPIGEGFFFEETVSAREFVRDLADVDADRIVVRINSEGGSVPDGIAIHNALRRHSASVDVEIDGMALSIASVIAMAGDNIRMPSNAMLMIHAPWSLAVGNARDMRAHADVLDKWSEAMTQAFVRVVGEGNAEMVNGLLTDGDDHWYTAGEAEDAGFITEMTNGVAIAAAHDLSHFNNSSIPAAAAALIRKKEHPMPKPNNGGRDPKPADPKTNPNTPAPAASGNDPAPSPAPANPAPKAGQSVEEFKAAEASRRKDIRARFAAFAGYTGVADLQAACMDDMTISASVARDKLMDLLGEGAEPLGGAQAAGAFETGADEVSKRREAKSHALLARMGGQKDEAGKIIAFDGANPYRGQTLAELAKGSLAEVGVDVSGQHVSEFAGQALSYHVMAAGGQTTSDFPVILEDVMHKLMMGGWAATPVTYDQWCKIGDVTDFREWKRLVPGLMGGFNRKNEAGEYVNKNVPDAEGESIRAEEFGNIITISRQVLVNDDIGYIQTMASGLGMAGRRGIERDVYALLASNPTLKKDGKKLFSTAHGNIATTGAAPSETAMVELADLMREQKAPGADGEYLDISPQVSVSRHTVQRQIRAINDAPYSPDQALAAQVPNTAAGLLDNTVGTPRLSGNAWYFFANANVAPVVEVVFLNGQREPALIQEETFRTGSLSWRPTLDYGVGAIDYRGAAMNGGA